MIAFVRLLATYARVTTALVVACVIVFGLEAVGARNYDVLSGTGRGLSPVLAFGVTFRPAIDDGEWWRFVTAGFLHFGILHLIFNMYALAFVGLALEPRFGSARFAVIYAVALVGGNVAAYWLQSPRSVSAGASGAIMGLFGAMAVIGLRYRFNRQLLQSALLPIVINLAYGFSRPGISNAAHVGGLVTGFAAAWVIGVSPRWRQLSELQEQRALLAAREREAVAATSGELPSAVANDPTNRLELRGTTAHRTIYYVFAAVFGLLGASLLVVAVFIAMGDPDPLVEAIVVGATILMVGASYYFVRRANPVLILTPIGFTAAGPRSPLVRWQHVSGFSVRSYGYGRQFVAYTWSPAYIARQPSDLSSLWRTLDGTIPAVFGIKPEEQARLLEEWRQRWTG